MIFASKPLRLRDPVVNRPRSISTRADGKLGDVLMGKRHHGTVSGYSKGCRCKPCVQAQQAYTRARRERG